MLACVRTGVRVCERKAYFVAELCALGCAVHASSGHASSQHTATAPAPKSAHD